MTTDTEQTPVLEEDGIQERIAALDVPEVTPPQPDERAMLIQRARMMGITVSNNIGIDTLKQRIQDKMDGVEKVEAKVAASLVDPSAPLTKKGRVLSLRQHLMQEAMKLIRIHIVNLDPKKKDLQGEIISVGNEYVGSIKKFVSYGEVTENGFHVPNAIYKALKRRKYLNIRTRKGKDGHLVIEQNWVQEFAITVLPPLTAEELKQLGTAQLASGSLN